MKKNSLFLVLMVLVALPLPVSAMMEDRGEKTPGRSPGSAEALAERSQAARDQAGIDAANSRVGGGQVVIRGNERSEDKGTSMGAPADRSSSTAVPAWKQSALTRSTGSELDDVPVLVSKRNKPFSILADSPSNRKIGSAPASEITPTTTTATFSPEDTPSSSSKNFSLKPATLFSFDQAHTKEPQGQQENFTTGERELSLEDAEEQVQEDRDYIDQRLKRIEGQLAAGTPIDQQRKESIRKEAQRLYDKWTYESQRFNSFITIEEYDYIENTRLAVLVKTAEATAEAAQNLLDVLATSDHSSSSFSKIFLSSKVTDQPRDLFQVTPESRSALIEDREKAISFLDIEPKKRRNSDASPRKRPSLTAPSEDTVQAEIRALLATYAMHGRNGRGSEQHYDDANKSRGQLRDALQNRVTTRERHEKAEISLKKAQEQSQQAAEFNTPEGQKKTFLGKIFGGSKKVSEVAAVATAALGVGAVTVPVSAPITVPATALGVAVTTGSKFISTASGTANKGVTKFVAGLAQAREYVAGNTETKAKKAMEEAQEKTLNMAQEVQDTEKQNREREYSATRNLAKNLKPPVRSLTPGRWKQWAEEILAKQGWTHEPTEKITFLAEQGRTYSAWIAREAASAWDERIASSKEFFERLSRKDALTLEEKRQALLEADRATQEANQEFSAIQDAISVIRERVTALEEEIQKKNKELTDLEKSSHKSKIEKKKKGVRDSLLQLTKDKKSLPQELANKEAELKRAQKKMEEEEAKAIAIREKEATTKESVLIEMKRATAHLRHDETAKKEIFEESPLLSFSKPSLFPDEYPYLGGSSEIEPPLMLDEISEEIGRSIWQQKEREESPLFREIIPHLRKIVSFLEGVDQEKTVSPKRRRSGLAYPSKIVEPEAEDLVRWELLKKLDDFESVPGRTTSSEGSTGSGEKKSASNGSGTSWQSTFSRLSKTVATPLKKVYKRIAKRQSSPVIEPEQLPSIDALNKIEEIAQEYNRLLQQKRGFLDPELLVKDQEMDRREMDDWDNWLQKSELEKKWASDRARWDLLHQVNDYTHKDEEARRKATTALKHDRSANKEFTTALAQAQNFAALASEYEQKWLGMAEQAIEGSAPEDKEVALEQLKEKDRTVNSLIEKIEAEQPQQQRKYQDFLLEKKAQDLASCFHERIGEEAALKQYEEATFRVAKEAALTPFHEIKVAWKERVKRAKVSVIAAEKRVLQVRKEDPVILSSIQAAEKELERATSIRTIDERAFELYQSEVAWLAPIREALLAERKIHERAVTIKEASAAKDFFEGDVKAWSELTPEERAHYNKEVRDANEKRKAVAQAELDSAKEDARGKRWKVSRAKKSPVIADAERAEAFLANMEKDIADGKLGLQFSSLLTVAEEEIAKVIHQEEKERAELRRTLNSLSSDEKKKLTQSKLTMMRALLPENEARTALNKALKDQDINYVDRAIKETSLAEAAWETLIELHEFLDPNANSPVLLHGKKKSSSAYLTLLKAHKAEVYANLLQRQSSRAATLEEKENSLDQTLLAEKVAKEAWHVAVEAYQQGEEEAADKDKILWRRELEIAKTQEGIFKGRVLWGEATRVGRTAENLYDRAITWGSKPDGRFTNEDQLDLWSQAIEACNHTQEAWSLVVQAYQDNHQRASEESRQWWSEEVARARQHQASWKGKVLFYEANRAALLADDAYEKTQRALHSNTKEKRVFLEVALEKRNQAIELCTRAREEAAAILSSCATQLASATARTSPHASTKSLVEREDDRVHKDTENARNRSTARILWLDAIQASNRRKEAMITAELSKEHGNILQKNMLRALRKEELAAWHDVLGSYEEGRDHASEWKKKAWDIPIMVINLKIQLLEAENARVFY